MEPRAGAGVPARGAAGAAAQGEPASPPSASRSDSVAPSPVSHDNAQLGLTPPFGDGGGQGTWELGDIEEPASSRGGGRGTPSGLAAGGSGPLTTTGGFGGDEAILGPIPSLPPSPLPIPLELAVAAPSLSANRPSAVASSPALLGIHRPKGGYLYVRILAAGNLDALEQKSVCGCGSAGCCGCRPLCGGCCFAGGCSPCCCCGPRAPPQFRLAIECASLERTIATTSPSSVDAKTHVASFNEELLLRSLSYCGMEKVSISLQTKSGATVAAAAVPLRAALPQALCRHALDCDQILCRGGFGSGGATAAAEATGVESGRHP